MIHAGLVNPVIGKKKPLKKLDKSNTSIVSWIAWLSVHEKAEIRKPMPTEAVATNTSIEKYCNGNSGMLLGWKPCADYTCMV